ncbi:MAG TPA: hypothetical protein PLO59_03225 [Bacteroidia bacterium]|nr:hypothetical protein [Bacteroidia bacterium]
MLRKMIRKIICIGLILITNHIATAQSFTMQHFTLPKSISIRALAVLNDSVCWLGGSNSTFGYTTDAGITWTTDSIATGKLTDFRSIAVINDSTILLANIGSPARIYRSSDYGKHFTVVYENNHSDVFIDALSFKNNSEGYAVSDPVNQCILILHTIDGGNTWQPVPCNSITTPDAGEAFFAASNSNIIYTDNGVHILSGGNRSRIFSNHGKGFIAYDTPVIRGAPMHGIYTACAQNQNIFIGGGDYNNKSYNHCNKAVSNNGGISFKLVANGKPPGIISCAQYVPHKSKNLLALSLPGIYYSKNNGTSWKLIDAQANYYTCRFSPSGKVCYLAGPKGNIAILWFKQ